MNMLMSMMSMLKGKSQRPLNSESGAEVIELGLVAALIIAGAIVLLSPIGTAIVTAYQAIVDALP